MKKLFILFSAIILIVSGSQSAKALTDFGYAWYAMNAYGQYLPNVSSLSVKVSIMDGPTTRYSELHTGITTNQFAIFIIEVGTGTPLSPYNLTNFTSVTFTSNLRLKAEVSTDGINFNIVNIGNLSDIPKEALPLDPASLPPDLVYISDSPSSGDITGTYATGFNIAAGAVTNTEIDGAARFVDVRNSAGTSQFYVTNGNNALSFEGTGDANVSFNPVSHKVTIDVTPQALPPNMSWVANESFVTWIPAPNLPNSKIALAGNALSSAIGASDITLNVLSDGTTIGTNGLNQLYLLNNAVTSAKIFNGTILPEDLNMPGGVFGISISGNAATATTATTAVTAANALNANQVTNPLTNGSGIASFSFNGSTSAQVSIADGGITNAMLAANSVNSGNIIDASITPTDLSNAVYSIDINGNAASAGMVNNSLTAGAGIAGFTFNGSTPAQVSIANGGITNAMLAANSVNSGNIIDASITPSDLSNDVYSIDINGNAASAGMVNNSLTAGAGIASFSFNGSTPAQVSIANGGITNAMLAANSVNSGNIIDASITPSDLSNDLYSIDIDGNAASADMVNNSLTAGAGIAAFSFNGSSPAQVVIADEGVVSSMIANGAVGSDKIADATVFANVGDGSTSQFSVTDGNNTLNFIGTGGNATVNFIPATHTIEISVPPPPAIPSGLIGSPFITYNDDPNLTEDKVLTAGNAVAVTQTLGTVDLNVLYDGTTIGKNLTNQLEVMDNAITGEKIAPGAISNSDIDASAAIDVLKLAGGTNGQILTTVGTTTVWTNPNSVVAGSVANDLTVGAGLVFDAGTTFNGSVARQISIGSGAVTSAMIQDGTISNIDISASAGISVSKLSATTSDNGKVLTVVAGVPTWSADASGSTFSYQDANTSGSSINLSSATATVIEVNKNVTALPVGSGGKMLVLINTSGNNIQISDSGNLSETVTLHGKRSLVLYWATNNGKWHPQDNVNN